MKYCLLKDAPLPQSVACGQILTGCEIYGVHHDCEGCPNLTEMGETNYSAYANEQDTSVA